MKNFLLTLIALFSFMALQAQQNMSQLSNWDGNNIQKSGVYYNDIWGYVDDQGNEYAVIGSPTKVHFVDVTNATSPVVKAEFTTGANSIWRDMKSFDRYVYGVADEGSEGLTIFDMSALPGGAITQVYQSNSVFSRAHNIYIDSPNERLYVVGSNTQNGGVIVYSLANPANPSVIANISLPGGYVHDIFVQNNIAYASHGYNGLYVYDFTNATNPVSKSSINTGGYNHSSWINESGSHLIYAEEVPAGRPLGMIDLAGVNNNNISIASTFSYPLEAPNATNVTYHNPFILDDYAVISSYLDGVTIMDISNPSNPTLAAYYDTDPSNTSYPGLDGSWGVYPYFPSGNIIATDIANGLFVLGTTITLTSDCSNGVQDVFETGIDCGGFCKPCAAAPPSCDDGVQNGDETGVDCGGANCPACPSCSNVTVTIVVDNYPVETTWTITDASGQTVASGGNYDGQPSGSTVTADNCLTDGCYNFNIFDSYGDGICCGYGNGSYSVTDNLGAVLASGGSFASSESTNFCINFSEPTCNDGVQNGDETGVDCGGSSCEACPVAGCTDTGAHNYDPNATLDDGSCETCSDNVLNGDETGVDCGGALCGPCPVPGCMDASAHNYNPNATVDDGSCETCSDGEQNGDETGVDCGGALCNACNVDVPGCTDASAHNYDVNATVDDGSCETCSDNVLNGDETGVDCGGALCDACPIPGCTDASAHNYDPNATVNDGSCETCNDGVRNGDETGVDCGGALCSPCDPGGCSDVTIDSNNFDSGWGIWNDGGSDARRSANDAAYANSGNYCIRLRDNTTSSTMTTDPLNLSNYQEITIDFSFIAVSMETNEDFFVEMDNGNGYTTIANYASGSDFSNNVRVNYSELVTGPFSSSTTIRIRCDASGNGDRIYIDDVVISGCVNNFAPEEAENITPIEIINKPTPAITALTLYPNPTRDELNVRVSLLETEAMLYVMDITGKVMRILPLAEGTALTQINTSQFVPGYYFVTLVEADGYRTTKKFVVAR